MRINHSLCPIWIFFVCFLILSMTPASALQYSSANYDFNSIDSPSDSYMDSNFLESGPTPSTVINNQYTVIGSAGDVCGGDPSFKRHVETIGSNGKPRYLLELTVASIIIFTIAMAVYNAYTSSLAKSSLLFYDMDVPVGKPIDPKITVPVGVPIPENSMPAVIGSLVESVNSLNTPACNIAGYSPGNVLNMPNVIFLWVSQYQMSHPVAVMDLHFPLVRIPSPRNNVEGVISVPADPVNSFFTQKESKIKSLSEAISKDNIVLGSNKHLNRLLQDEITAEEKTKLIREILACLPPNLIKRLRNHLPGSASPSMQNAEQTMQETRGYDQLQILHLSPFRVPFEVPFLQAHLTDVERQDALINLNNQINGMNGNFDYIHLARWLANRPLITPLDIAIILRSLRIAIVNHVPMNHAAWIFHNLEPVTQLLVAPQLGFTYFDQILIYLEDHNRIPQNTWINIFEPFDGTNPTFHALYTNLLDMYQLHRFHRAHHAMFNNIPLIENNPRIFPPLHNPPIDLTVLRDHIRNPPAVLVTDEDRNNFRYIAADYMGTYTRGQLHGIIIEVITGTIQQIPHIRAVRDRILLNFLNGLDIDDIVAIIYREEMLSTLADSGFDLDRVALAFIRQEAESFLNLGMMARYMYGLNLYMGMLNHARQVVFFSALPPNIQRLLHPNIGIGGNMAIPRMVIRTVAGHWYNILMDHYSLIMYDRVFAGANLRNLGLATHIYIRDNFLGTTGRIIPLYMEDRQNLLVETTITRLNPVVRQEVIHNRIVHGETVTLVTYMQLLYRNNINHINDNLIRMLVDVLIVDPENYAYIHAPFFMQGTFTIPRLEAIIGFVPAAMREDITYRIFAQIVQMEYADGVIEMARHMLDTTFWQRINGYIRNPHTQNWFIHNALRNLGLNNNEIREVLTTLGRPTNYFESKIIKILKEILNGIFCGAIRNNIDLDNEINGVQRAVDRYRWLNQAPRNNN